MWWHRRSSECAASANAAERAAALDRPEKIAHRVVFLVENDFAPGDTLYIASGE
jgi:hypothetical protein